MMLFLSLLFFLLLHHAVTLRVYFRHFSSEAPAPRSVALFAFARTLLFSDVSLRLMPLLSFAADITIICFDA